MPAKNALLKLMDQVASSTSPELVYSGALACLRDTLGVDCAAVLVPDDAGIVRCVAAMNVSDECRSALERRCPWPRGGEGAAPWLIADVERDERVTEWRDVFAAERIRALGVIPLRFGPRRLGEFMLCYGEPHEFSDDEAVVAQLIAGHVAFAVEHHRIAAALEARLGDERTLRRDAEIESALREESQRRLHLALAAGRMGAWDWDIASGRVQWSAELEALHGFAPGEFAGTFEAFRRDVHPADRERLEAAITAALERPDEVFECEYRVVTPDGDVRWMASKGRVLTDSSGRPVRMTGICSDVTAAKRTQESRAFLAEASRILSTTLDPEATIKNLARIVVPRLADWCVVQVVGADGRNAPVEVAHRDPAKVELAWSIVRRWPTRPTDVGGATAVIQTGAPSLVPRIGPEMLAARAQSPEHLAALQSLGLHSAVTVPLQARGRVLGALSLMSAESGRVYDAEDLRFAEEIASWAALAIDNAQLYRQAEDARAVAERARRHLEALAEISDELATELDPDAALKRLASRVVTTFADYCVTYATDGRSIRRLGFAHRDPAQLPLVEALSAAAPPSLDDLDGLGAVVRTGEPLLLPELSAELLRLSAPSPELLDTLRRLDPRSVIIVPLKARGRTLGAIALVATAASARRYDHDDLRIAIELANRAALLLDNARLYTEARSAIRARDDMIAVVSHDLRNPLQSISAAAALLQLDPPPERRTRSLQSIMVASEQMGRLLQDLLDISRMDAGQFSITREPLEVASLIAEAQTLFQPQAEDKSVRLVCRVAPDLPHVLADRGRIMQVLTNLLGNALKFVPAEGTITVTADRWGDGVRVAVADTGMGIAPEHLPRVFERFWRGDRRKERGAGLGLAVAKGIVEAHGGWIGVESSPGQGSTFYFTLRAAPTAQSAPVRIDRERERDGKPGEQRASR
ncbi:MAG TPA: GAF domain-containing protein [Gammaproteobacteria bacterium]